MRRYFIRLLKASHQPIRDSTDGEQIERKRKDGEQARRTLLIPFFPKADGNPERYHFFSRKTDRRY
jgi:hypothetical protein